MSRFHEILSIFINRVATTTGSLFLLGAVLLLVTTITSRRLMGIGILISYDLFALMVGVFGICAMVYCTFHSGHVTVPIVFTRLPKSVQNVLSIVHSLAIAGIWGLIAVVSVWHAVQQWQLGEATLATRIPVYPFRAFSAFGAAILSVVGLTKFLTAVKKRVIRN